MDRRRLSLLLLLTVLGFGSSQGEAGAQQRRRSVEVGDGHALAYGGQYRVLFDASNFTFHPRSLSPNQGDGAFSGYRFRPWVNLYDSDSERYGVYVQIEVGGFAWSRDRDVSKDVDVVLRRGYVWYKPTESSLLRAGVLDWHDAFGERPSFSEPMWAVDAYGSSRAPLASSVWNFSVLGMTFDFEPSDRWHVGTGAMALQKGDRALEGDTNAWLFTGDIDRELGSTASVGLSAYYLRDEGGYSYRERLGKSWDGWAGARGHFQVWRLRSSLFAIVNRGRVERADWEHQGHALKAVLETDLLGATVSGQALYSSGNDGSEIGRSGEFRTIAQSAGDGFGGQSYWSYGGLSSPRGPSDLNDLGVGLQNRGLGLVTLQAALARRLTSTVSGYAGYVWLRSDAPRPESESREMGHELLVEGQWTIKGPLVLDVGAAYFWTGNFYRERGGASPQDLYQGYFRLQVEF